VLTALDLLGIPTDFVPPDASWRRLLGRVCWADAVVHPGGPPGGRVGLLAHLLRRRVPSAPAVTGPPVREAGQPAGEQERPALEQLGTEFLRQLGTEPPGRPCFSDLGSALRKKQDAIWTAMTWPPPDPAIRREADDELEALLRYIEPHDGLTLDVGCGAGRGARALAERSRAVVAMDLSLEMLRRLRTDGPPTRSPIHPVLADAEHLPFRSGAFSSTTAIQVWAHLEFPETLVGELHRVTAPGATVAVSTGNAHSLIELHDRLILFLHELRKTDLRRAGEALRGARTYWLTLRGFARSTVGSVMHTLERAGFKVIGHTGVGLLRTPRGYLPEVLSRWPGARRFGHLLLVGARHDARPRAVASWKALCADALAAFVSPDGDLAYRRTASGRVSADPPVYSTRERYRLISLIGLEAFRRSAGTDDALEAISARIARNLEPGIEDAGLFLWWKALRGEADAEETRTRIRKAGLVELARQDTQTLAFLLLGLTAGARREPEDAGLAEDVAALVRSRQEASGLFHALARRDSVATFNYQVYAGMALASFGQVHGRPDDVAAARACGQRLCRLQGQLGQWWWTYDVRRGRIADRYPVFSVHQLGMAPLALFRIGKACGDDFSPWVRRGARWIVGPNESGSSLIAPDALGVWRSVRRRSSENSRVAHALKWLAWHRVGALSAVLPPDEVNREHRPYEYGWLLAALGEVGGDESWLP
jgi:SAM-dependent methyltransferase